MYQSKRVRRVRRRVRTGVVHVDGENIDRVHGAMLRAGGLVPVPGHRPSWGAVRHHLARCTDASMQGCFWLPDYPGADTPERDGFLRHLDRDLKFEVRLVDIPSAAGYARDEGVDEAIEAEVHRMLEAPGLSRPRRRRHLRRRLPGGPRGGRARRADAGARHAALAVRGAASAHCRVEGLGGARPLRRPPRLGGAPARSRGGAAPPGGGPGPSPGRRGPPADAARRAPGLRVARPPARRPHPGRARRLSLAPRKARDGHDAAGSLHAHPGALPAPPRRR